MGQAVEVEGVACGGAGGAEGADFVVLHAVLEGADHGLGIGGVADGEGLDGGG